jgi:glycosyltransferase involved in cell wall biosynthesis
MDNHPMITVGLPVYNGGRFLDETISSILCQDVASLELIISDNCSTDNTRSIVEKRASSDDRIRAFFSDKNRGAAWNFNHVLRLARGKYFHWSGYDDLMDVTMLRRCIDALEEVEGSILAYPRTSIIDYHGAFVKEYDNGMNLIQTDAAARLFQYLKNIGMANPIFGVFPTVMIRAVGGLGSYPSADLVTLARLALVGKVVEVPKLLFSRRIHDKQSWRDVGLHEGFAKWFDTSSTKKIVFTDWRVFREMLLACLRENLPLGQKIRCLGTVLYLWPRRRFRGLTRELLRIRIIFRRKNRTNKMS